MTVVDTNVLAYLYLPGPYSKSAEALLSREPDWVAPRLWRSEFCNILASYLRQGKLELSQAQNIQAEAEALLFNGHYEVDSAQVLKLSAASGCTAYDCEFVALALQLKLSLVTMDAQVIRAFPAVAVSLVA